MSSHDHSGGAECPTCQGNEKMRRQIDEEADFLARERFRTWVVMYFAYPVVILSLLLVIVAGAYYFYTTRGVPTTPIATGPEPPWCASQVGTVANYLQSGPQSQQSAPGGYESAIPPGGAFAPSLNVSVGTSMFGPPAPGTTAAIADRLSYYVYESIKAADGSPEARYRRDMISLSQVEMGVARQRFVERSRQHGKLGFLRLGVTQLGEEAYSVAEQRDLTVPFCKPSNFATADKGQAYVNFSIAKFCDSAQATRATPVGSSDSGAHTSA